jgi:transcription antitermination factor NusG
MSWYAIQTRGACEPRVRDRLRELAITEFWPNYHVKAQRSDRIQVLEKPLFPCYLFGQFELCAWWHKIHLLPGVIRVLGSFEHPQAVPDSDVSNIRKLMESPAATLPCPFLAFGDPVRVMRGPMAGLEGFAIRSKQGGCRIVISVQMIGQSCSVEVDAGWICQLPKPVAHMAAS